MAAKSCDDPMDLGPFLQNYVLKNPFGQPFFSASASKTSSSSAAAAADSPVTSSNSEKMSGGITRGLRSRHTYPHKTRQRQRRLLPSPTANTRRNRPAHQLEPRSKTSSGSKSDLTTDLEENEDRSATCPPDELMENAIIRLRKVVAERNGSGVDEADSEVLDVEHLALLAWLRDNYRCLRNGPRMLVATQQLLLRVQQVVPDVTADMVDDAVTAMFPTCVKMVKRHGQSFYGGLIARPEPDFLENPIFANAITDIQSGSLTSGQAASKYGIRESALVGAIVWLDEGFASSPVHQSPTNRRRLLSSAAPNDDVSSHNGNGNGSLESSSRVIYYLSRKRQLGSKGESDHEPLERRVKTEKNSAETGDNVDFELMLQDIPSSVLEYDHEENSSLTATSPQHVTTDIDSSTSNNSQPSSCSVEPDTVAVKIEVDDLEDVSVADTNSQPLNYSPQGRTQSSASVHTSSNAISATATNHESQHATDLSLPQRAVQAATTSVSQTCNRDSSRDDSTGLPMRRLRDELMATREANLALQEELNTRDFHLVQLAEDFYRLHEQFKLLARHFQMVLGEIQPPVPGQSQMSNGDVVQNSHR